MKDLTEGNIHKTFILFAIPLVLSGLLSQAYSVIDTVIAGKFLGEEGLAAIGATAPFISFVSSFFWGYSTGASIYVARLFGAREYDRIRQTVWSQLLFLAFLAIVIAAIAVAGRNVIFDFLKIEESLRDAAFRYFGIYIGGLFLIMMTFHAVYFLNAMGSSSFPFWMSLLSAVINIGGNILSVTVLGLGVEGLALASVFAALVVSICYVFRFRAAFRSLGCAGRCRLSFRHIRLSLSYSIPVALQQMAMYFAGMVLSPIVNGIGTSATAAYTVVARVYDVNAGIYQNSAKTLGNYVAQCMGAEKADRIPKGLKAALAQGLLFLVPVLMVCVFFPEEICMLFFRGEELGESFTLAVLFARVYLPFILFNMVNNLFHNLFRGVKRMGLLMASTFFGAAVRIVASAILAVPYGMAGFYAGWVISWIAEVIFCLVVWFTGKWMPREVREMLAR